MNLDVTFNQLTAAWHAKCNLATCHFAPPSTYEIMFLSIGLTSGQYGKHPQAILGEMILKYITVVGCFCQPCYEAFIHNIWTEL